MDPGKNTASAQAPSQPAKVLAEGRAHQLAGRLRDAAESYAMAVDLARETKDVATLVQGLRWLGVVHHLQGETATGQYYCKRSLESAMGAGLKCFAAEATMALANMACEQGKVEEARTLYRHALQLAPEYNELVARIEQNLGMVESVQGNLATALDHFSRALRGYEALKDSLGCAKVHHNMGMIRADQKQWEAAIEAYDKAEALARQGGDCHLGALCLLNRAEVELAKERFDEARRLAEQAMGVFDRLGARVDLADAYRMTGIALRHLDRPTLAESRLRSALEIAASAGVPLTEAESCRDMGTLLAKTGRCKEAIGFLDRAVQLFQQIGATLDAGHVSDQRTLLMAA